MSNTTPIVNDYIPIAQRLAQIEQDRLAASFVLPHGIVILPASSITVATRPPQCDLCLALHDTVGRLTVFTIDDARPHTVRDFLGYLTRCFPSARLARGEIQLSLEDSRKLAARLQVLAR